MPGLLFSSYIEVTRPIDKIIILVTKRNNPALVETYAAASGSSWSSKTRLPYFNS